MSMSKVENTPLLDRFTSTYTPFSDSFAAKRRDFLQSCSAFINYERSQSLCIYHFLKELFPQYMVELYAEIDSERAEIKNKEFRDVITVNYWPENYYTYYLLFATQHRETSNKEQLIAYVTAFANAEKAAIEFYENGSNRFGGEIETSLLGSLTYDSLRNYFGYPSMDISNLTFRVRAWHIEYCFDGMFIKDSFGTVQIVRKSVLN